MKGYRSRNPEAVLVGQIHERLEFDRSLLVGSGRRHIVHFTRERAYPVFERPERLLCTLIQLVLSEALSLPVDLRQFELTIRGPVSVRYEKEVVEI